MKYRSRQHFIDRVYDEHDRFLSIADDIGKHRFSEPGVWGDNWNIKDFFAHLTAWEQLCLSWHRTGLSGQTPELPAPGYKWNETPKLNHDIWARHKGDEWLRVATAFDESFDEIAALAESFSEPELLEPGRFAWTGKHPLVTYLGANTASHYATGCKILKRWKKTAG